VAIGLCEYSPGLVGDEASNEWGNRKCRFSGLAGAICSDYRREHYSMVLFSPCRFFTDPKIAYVILNRHFALNSNLCRYVWSLDQF